MSIFDFITDEDFRESLVQDNIELNQCFEASSWKAVQVLSGSIVESVLTDHLINQKIVSKAKAVKLDLGEILKLCIDNNIISETTAQLSSVIKNYRNLIHPGRAIRMGEGANEDSATVAKSVVQIILKEISKEAQEKYGYTAEQIASKLERDSTARAILPDLLSETSAPEIEKLLTEVLPKKYRSYDEAPWGEEEIHSLLISCFREAFDKANETIKSRVAKYYIKVIKEGSSSEIDTYIFSFFEPLHFSYYDDKDYDLVLRHIISRLTDNLSSRLLTRIDGIGEFLRKDDIRPFIDPLVRAIITDHDAKGQVIKFLKNQYPVTPEDIDADIVKRFDEWIEHLNKRNVSAIADIIADIKKMWETVNPED